MNTSQVMAKQQNNLERRLILKCQITPTQIQKKFSRPIYYERMQQTVTKFSKLLLKLSKAQITKIKLLAIKILRTTIKN